MTASLHAPALRDETGFTLVEMVVAMTLSMIVLFAALTTFDNFSSDAARQTRITDANDHVRRTMDRVVSDLRQAAKLEVADDDDLVYTVTDSATATRRERICMDASNHLWRASVTTTSPPATPNAYGTPCPTAGSGATRIADLASASSSTNPLFRYDSATPANVRSVGLTFALDAGTPGRTDTSTLRASAFVRAKSETAPPVDPDDIVVTCSSAGIPTLTLAASAGSLGVSYTDIDGNALGSASAGTSLVISSQTTVIANITSSSGIVSQIVKTIAC